MPWMVIGFPRIVLLVMVRFVQLAALRAAKENEISGLRHSEATGGNFQGLMAGLSGQAKASFREVEPSGP